MSSAKWRPSCLGLNVLNELWLTRGNIDATVSRTKQLNG